MKIEIEENYVTVDGVKYLPEVKIETILEIGKWYKDKSSEYKGLICIVEYNGENEGVTAYGFGWNSGEFKETHSNWVPSKNSKKDLIEASEQEVFEALKNEAIKRGFDHGVYFIVPNSKTISICQNQLMLNERNNQILYFGDYSIFHNGVWGDILETITKQEAEALLNKKIV